MPLPSSDQDILFTRQKHQADRAGLHYDLRMVIGDKAYSWATKKDMPERGGSIILHEQPVHDRGYALSKKVVIPKGQYGAGVTELDWVKKGKLEVGKDYYVVKTKKEKWLLKPVPSYGEKMWLFKNLSPENKYLEKIAATPLMRARTLAEKLKSNYRKTKLETPDLVNKIRNLKDRLSRVDNIAWELELNGK